MILDSLFSEYIENLTCHEECMGDCTDPTANGCKVCKHYRIMLDGKCVSECPTDLFAYKGFCVDADFCTKANKKPIFGECRESCPLIFSETYGDNPSVEQCARECPGTEIESLATSDLLRGCQIVKGDIFIRLPSGFDAANTMQILEQNLGDIEEIEGILKIYRSPVITSLSFFRSLRIIRGNKSENSKYTFIILSNDNLQELWDFNEKKSLELVRGNLQIHFNSKLCLTQIHQLQKLLKTNTSADFISTESNGQEQTCSAKVVVTWSKVLNSTSVEISWKKIHVSESEKVIGFIIYYIVAPIRNVTHLGVDTCVQ